MSDLQSKLNTLQKELKLSETIGAGVATTSYLKGQIDLLNELTKEENTVDDSEFIQEFTHFLPDNSYLQEKVIGELKDSVPEAFKFSPDASAASRGIGILRHPTHEFRLEDGTVISSRTLAQNMAENIKPGSILVFPNTTDESGKYVWDFTVIAQDFSEVNIVRMEINNPEIVPMNNVWVDRNKDNITETGAYEVRKHWFEKNQKVLDNI